MKPYNFFALTTSSDEPIYKISTSKEVQNELSDFFEEQESEFFRDIEEEIPFDGKYHPEKHELLVIGEFVYADFFHKAITKPHAYPNLQLTNEVLGSVRAIFCGYQDGDKKRILVQGFDRQRVISNRGFSLIHSGDTFKKLDGDGITLANKLNAVIDGEDLKFSSFHFAHRIFDLSFYFIAATDKELDEFCKHSAFLVPSIKEFQQCADDWVRRRVSLIHQSGLLNKITVPQIAELAKNFNVDLEIDPTGKKIVLPNDRKKLKGMLRVLDEDYYISPITATKFLSNSKRAIA